MNVEELKLEIIKILGEVVFNTEFKKHAYQLKNQKESLLVWCKLVAEKEIKAEPSKLDKEIIIFIKKIGSSNRCVVIKQKNGQFTECHLGDHKYYDYLRKQLGL